MDIRALCANTGYALKRHAPTILTGCGVVLVVSGTVAACLATTKARDILELHKKEAEEARNEADVRKALTKAYLRTFARFAKLYGPSVAIELLGIVSILTGHGMMKKRNAALAAAYATIDGAFRKYRERVKDRYGDEAEEEIRLGLEEAEIEDENGGKKKVTAINGGLSGYARYFAVGESTAAEENLDLNYFRLKGEQDYWNSVFPAQQIVFLNDVYIHLGIKPTVAGQSVGWIYDKNRADHGDNYIDLRAKLVWRLKDDGSGEHEQVWMIDPNVDGPIIEHAKELTLLV